jgi:hypothetical protein
MQDTHYVLARSCGALSRRTFTVGIHDVSSSLLHHDPNVVRAVLPHFRVDNTRVVESTLIQAKTKCLDALVCGNLPPFLECDQIRVELLPQDLAQNNVPLDV